MSRRTVLLLLLAAVLVATSTVWLSRARAGGDTPVMPSIATGWQLSAPRSGLDHLVAGDRAELGVRQKYGAPGMRFHGTMSVRNPAGQTATTSLTVTGDEWAFVQYPEDFPNAPPTQPGTYRITVTIDGYEPMQDSFVIE